MRILRGALRPGGYRGRPGPLPLRGRFGHGGTYAGYLAKAGDLAEFAGIFNQKEKSVRLESAEDGLLFIYPECYCACVKRVPEPVPRTWCLCTLGHVRSLFSQVLGREPEVELLETVKSGGERCVIKVII